MPATQKPFGPLGCALKLIVGSLFVITLVWVTVYGVAEILPEKWHLPWLLVPIGIVALVVGAEVATVVLARGESTPFGILGPKYKDLTLESLRRKGQIVSDEFRARRAFEVEEYNDEGTHYYIELEDGSVLYLSGQYLYDYDAIEESPPDDDLNQPRLFPATEFVIHRHKRQGYVVEIEPKGPAFEPEYTAACFASQDGPGIKIPLDGEVITDRTYDELKALFPKPGKGW